MKIILDRFYSDSNSTVGSLYVNGLWECFTLEDPKQEVKISKKTRIPSGEYEIILREVVSPMTEKYRNSFPDFFDYHLMLKDVPNFEYIYIHVGNTHKDSDGCILVGASASVNKETESTFVGNSQYAFSELYKIIREAIRCEEKVFIKIKDNG